MGRNDATPKRGSLAYRDRSYARRSDAGWSIADTAPRQKIIAEILGTDQPRVSREISGERGGTTADFHEIVRRAVRERHADAGALIAGCMVVAEDEASKLPLHEIVYRLCEALAQETAFECEENLAEHELLVALGILVSGVEPTVRQLAEVRATAEQYERKSCREIGGQINGVIYSRALRTHFGWRQAP